MNEQWRAVVGFEGCYEVSDLGRVRSLDRLLRSGRRRRGRILHPAIDKYGYPTVMFSVDMVQTRRTVHSLVLIAFSGPRPKGMDCCHNDGDRANPKLSNLRWDTRSNNHLDRWAHGTMCRPNIGLRTRIHVPPPGHKTHCPYGHEYSGLNVYVARSGSVNCRACNRDRAMAARRRAARIKQSTHEATNASR